jgi:hypothetical protein
MLILKEELMIHNATSSSETGRIFQIANLGNEFNQLMIVLKFL